MKKLLLLLLFGLPAFGQLTNSGVTYVGSAPSGACSQAPPVQVLNSSGAIYTCDNGTWAVQGGSGGGVISVFGRTGTVTAQTGDYAASQITGTANTYLLSALNGNVQTGPYTYLSQDGFSMLPLTKGGQALIYTDSGGFRDPRMLKIGSTYYMSYTNTTLGSLNATSIGLAFSSDLQNWTKVTTPNWSSFFTGSQTSIVNGCWWIDGSGNVYLIFAPATFGSFTAYYVQFTPGANTFGTPQPITFSPTSGTALPMAVWSSAGSTWALLQVPVGHINLATFTAISGTWSITKTGNWAGWESGTPGIESGALVILPSGLLRAYFTDANGSPPGGNIYYSNSSTSNPSTATWTASQAISPFSEASANASGIVADWVDIVPFLDTQTDQSFNALERSNPPADIQVVVSTTTVNANTCNSQTAAVFTGLSPTMTVHFTPATDFHATTGWSAAGPTLYFFPIPTANSLTYYVCNNSVSNITPGGATLWNVSAK